MTRFERNIAGDIGVGPKGRIPVAQVRGLDTQVLIVGGGLAGSLAALLLARRGQNPIVVDPFEAETDDLRGETFSGDEIDLARSLGVTEAFGGELAMATSGYRRGDMVAAVRALWPDRVMAVAGRAVGIVPGDQVVTTLLADGLQLTSRVAVVACQSDSGLLRRLGVDRVASSTRHACVVAFDVTVRPESQAYLDGAMAFGADGVDGRVTFVQDGDKVRVNVALFDDMLSLRVQRFRRMPLVMLAQGLPSCKGRFAGARLIGAPTVWSTDLATSSHSSRDGVVLIGEARAAACPVTGGAMARILGDVQLLTRTHLPQWLASASVGGDRIEGFYRDINIAKRDRMLLRRSRAARQLATSPALVWSAARMVAAIRRKAA